MIGIPNLMGTRFSLAPLGPRYLLYMWGDNNNGQLGRANTSPGSTPVIVKGNNWSTVALSATSSFAIKANGSLWAWGDNDTGQLGLRNTTNRSSPVQVGTDTNWSKVCSGIRHIIATTTDGKLWAWGLNTSGQLGLGDTTSRSSPVQVGTDTDWSKIGTGHYLSFGIKTNGTLWAWGYGYSGVLGIGSTTHRSSPVQVGGLTGWSKISSRNSSLAIRDNGTLWSWGRNLYGQLGLGNTTNRSSPVQVGSDTDWSDVSSGIFVSLATKTNGTLWMWGRLQGLLSGITANSISSPVQVGTDTNWKSIEANLDGTWPAFFATKNDDSLWAWGRDDAGNPEYNLSLPLVVAYSSPVQTISSSGWKKVIAGNGCGFLISGATGSTAGGSLWAFGYRFLGIGSYVSRLSSPIQVGTANDWINISSSPNNRYRTVGVRENGTLWAWGESLLQFAVNDLSPKQVGSLTDWRSANVGRNHVLATKNNNTLWAFGSNYEGQLGLGNTTTRSSPVQIGTNTDWIYVAPGAEHSLATNSNGELWSWGGNRYGELGINLAGSSTGRSSPVQIGGLTGWKNCFTCTYSSFAIRDNGTLWAWGRNNYGQLGLGNTINCSSPVQVGSDTDWATVSPGVIHILARKTNGTLWAWGRNPFGNLGIGSTTNRSSPVQVGTDTNWYDVAAGRSLNVFTLASFSLSLKNDGTMWGWGNKRNAQIATSSGAEFSAPIQIGSLTGFALPYKIGGRHSGAIRSILPRPYYGLYVWGGAKTSYYRNLGINLSSSDVGRSTPVKVGTSKNWTSISCGRFHNIATRADGTLWAWGTNSSGILGLGNEVHQAVPVRVGNGTDWKFANAGGYNASLSNTFAIKTNGTLWGWGSNNTFGQLGLNTTSGNRLSPVQVGSDTDWEYVNTAHMRAFAIKTNGTLWAWGLNSTQGRLGLGLGSSTTSTSSPIQVGTDTNWKWVNAGSRHTLAIKTNGTLWGWGYNSNGQLGLGDTTNRSSPIQIGSDSNWALVSCGIANNSFAIKTNGTLWAFGQNTEGNLGFGDPNTDRSSPVQIGTNTDWAWVNAGSRHTIAAKTNGTLWIWGPISNAAFGNGINVTYADRFTQVGTDTDWASVGARSGWAPAHGLAIKTGGTLWAWGYNGQGQLGLGDKTSRLSPVQVGTNADWKIVKTSSQSATTGITLAIKTNGTLWAWGINTFGQFGLGDKTSRSSPVQVGTDTSWNIISLGRFHNIATKTDGTLWAWGDNDHGQLGLGNTTSLSSPVQVGTDTNWQYAYCGTYHNHAIKTNGTLWAWGRNQDGQLGFGNAVNISSPVQVGTDTNWLKVIGGNTMTFAIKTDGTLWSWGSNSLGQLGLGNKVSRSSPVQVGTNTDWASVSTGISSGINAFVVATKTDGTMWTWGYNNFSQLGQGNTLHVSSPVQVGADTNWKSASASNMHGFALKTNGTLWAVGYRGTVSRPINLGIPIQNATSSPVQIGSATDWNTTPRKHKLDVTNLVLKRV